MTSLFLTLSLLLSSPMTAQDAQSPGFPDPDTVWQLEQADGTAFQRRATLTFPEPGRIAGQAPCNAFTGSIAGTPDAFTIGPVAATRMACPDLDAEQTFLTLLQGMVAAEIGEGRLVLRDAAGHELVFAVAAEQ